MPLEHCPPTAARHGLNLPSPLAELLLYASVGKTHRLRVATLALESLTQGGNGVSAPLAMDLLLSCYESDPADAGMAAQALHIGLKLGMLSPELSALLETAATGGTSSTLTHWRDGMAAWNDGHSEQALRHFRLSGTAFTTPLEYMGHCLAALGEEDTAIALWKEVLHRRPWHTQLYLTVHDYHAGHHTPLSPSGIHGQTAALFYSWNKADDLNAALASLANKDGTLPEGLALVACLDNGSTDATATVLHRWQERWGQRFLPLRLPVNVGAAAARNWLASLPEVRALPYAVYIDDDALLSPDWLGHLHRAVQVYPQAAVWGCRVVHAHAPQEMQCGPLHLQPLFCTDAAQGDPLPGQPDIPASDTLPDVAFSPLLAKGLPFRLTDHLCAGPDYGAYTFLRPCASVTGCCHMFRTEDLATHAFPLQFSPSQYDDAARDLLMLQQGRLACYTGFCTVRHAKRTGQGEAGQQALSGAAYGNGLGNLYKLHGLFDADAIAACVRHEYARVQQDFERRVARLEQCGVLC